MPLPIDPKVKAAHENKRLVKLFKEAYDEALVGKPHFGLYLQCYPDDRGLPSPCFTVAWDGSTGFDHTVVYALRYLEMHVLTGGMRRELPPSFSSFQRDVDYVVVNLAKPIHSYDFTAWLVDAEMTRVMQGAPAPLKICFAWPDHQGQGILDPHCQVMFEHVVKPMLKLIGAVETHVVSSNMKNHALYKDVVTMARQGVPTPKFSASGRALQTMRGYTDCVTITLRESTYWPHRNSNLFEWLKFAHWLKSRGERVIFVRDTIYHNEPIDNWEICPSASTDLELRMALYQQAKCNFFVSNGPWNLALFSDVPWAMFVTVETSEGYDDRDSFASSKAGWWEENHGVKQGEGQFPWSTPQQKIVWESDTYERMKETWLEFFGSDSHAGIYAKPSMVGGNGKQMEALTSSEDAAPLR